MKNLKFSRLFAAMMFVAVLALAGCKQQPEEKAKPIEGTWVSSTGEKWTISGSEVKNFYNGDLAYTGDSVEFNEETDSSGYIYLKYTRSFCATHSDFDNYVYTYDEDAPDVGKWYAIYYFDLTDDAVKISAASNYENGGVSSCDTLEEAKKTFTVANDYMSKAAKRYSTCTRE